MKEFLKRWRETKWSFDLTGFVFLMLLVTVLACGICALAVKWREENSVKDPSRGVAIGPNADIGPGWHEENSPKESSREAAIKYSDYTGPGVQVDFDYIGSELEAPNNDT